MHYITLHDSKLVQSPESSPWRRLIHAECQDASPAFVPVKVESLGHGQSGIKLGLRTEYYLALDTPSRNQSDSESMGRSASAVGRKYCVSFAPTRAIWNMESPGQNVLTCGELSWEQTLQAQKYLAMTRVILSDRPEDQYSSQ